MKYNVNDTIRIVTDDTSGYGKGYIGKITDDTEDTEDFTVYYEVDGRYEYCESEIELVKPSRIRGFEAIKGYEDVTLPQRKTKHSAGYDITTPYDITLEPGSFGVFPTGLKAYMADDERLEIHIRSSIGIKHRIILMNCTGIIDADFYENPDNDGHFMLALENRGTELFHVPKGTNVAQGIFSKYLVTDDDNVITVRQGGIGSTSD